MLRKTRKAALFRETKKLGVIVDDIGSKTASIDVMAVVQKMVVEHEIFWDIEKLVFTRIPDETNWNKGNGLKQSKCIGPVFDVYLDCSIENTEKALKKKLPQCTCR